MSPAKKGYKAHRTPWDIIHERDLGIKPEIAILPALLLDDAFEKKFVNPTRRGYDIVQYP